MTNLKLLARKSFPRPIPIHREWCLGHNDHRHRNWLPFRRSFCGGCLCRRLFHCKWLLLAARQDYSVLGCKAARVFHETLLRVSICRRTSLGKMRLRPLPLACSATIHTGHSTTAKAKIIRMNLNAIQSALREHQLDGWLFYDHHHRDPIAYRILGLDEDSFVSRRWFYFIPAEGEPRKLVHRIESGKLDSLPGTKEAYSSWQELEQKLEAMLDGAATIAMQYSPRNAIMYVAMVDAGTVELIRSIGKQVVSSADLVSVFEAVLTEHQIATHFEAQRRLDAVLTAGWKYIGESVRTNTPITEFDVVKFLLAEMQKAGLWTDHGPNCSAGPNSADSHYEPTREASRVICTGDFLLIDIWAS